MHKSSIVYILRKYEYLKQFKSETSRVMLSSIRTILNSSLSISTPLIFSLILILLAKISHVIIKRYVERKHPCLTPLYNFKKDQTVYILILSI